MRGDTNRAVRVRRGFWRAFGITLLFCLLGPGFINEASAEGGESGADALFRQGVRSLRAGRYDDAASMFRLSYQMERRAATMCNLALTYERAGREREALESYRQCAEDDTDGRFRDHALERARDLERRTGSQPEPLALSPSQTTHQPVAHQPVQQPVQPPVEQPYQPTTQRRRSNGALWAGLGIGLLGVAGLGTAIGLHVWANGVYDDLQAAYGNQIPMEESGSVDRMLRGENGVTAAIALYAVGGVLTGVGTILLLVGAVRAGRNRGTRIAIAPTDGGVALAVSFQLPAF